VAAVAVAASTVGGLGGATGTREASAKTGATTVTLRAAAEKTKRCKKNCAPTVAMSVSPAKVRVGQTATLTWSATGATSCTASDAWSGSQAVSGSLPVTPSNGGQFTYTLACNSGSATGYASAVLAVPIPVLPSSYENRMAAGDPAQARGMPTIGPGGNSFSPLPSWRFAWADFFQDGSYSLVFASTEKTAANVPADLVGHFYFFKLKPGFRYEDHTAEVLKDTTACLGSSSQALVADFNGDGVPDVYQECYGIDVGDAPGDQDHLLLSQPDGTFANIVVPGVGKSHGGTAADLNGDGLPDVMEAQIGRFPVGTPVQHRVLINNGDGTFHEERQRLPAMLVGKGLTQFELIDVGRGVRDLFVGGNVCGEESARAPTDCPSNWLPAQLMIQNDGQGSFVGTKVTQLPNPPGATGIVYGPGIDFVFVEPNLYWYQYSGAWSADILPFHADIIHRLNLTTGEYKRAFEHIGSYTGPGGVGSFFHFLPWGDGTMHIQCMLANQGEVFGLCAVSFPM
jgi:hypothetical protein